MQRQSAIATWCERIIEGGWLLALVLIPSYFNLLSSRHFEPDKATTLRAIVLLMLAALVIRWLEGLGDAPVARGATPPPESLWKRFAAFPMALPVALYVLVFLIATAVSIAPYVSFWGSYQRLQGTYTNLSYVALGVMVALGLRSRAQLDRLIAVLILGSLPVACYALIQHFQIDPLPWRGDVVSRVASTMGNSIFVAAYMILVVPFALARAIIALHTARRDEPSEAPAVDIGWGAAYALLVAGALVLAFSALQFGAVVRTADLRYWWVYPGALVVAFGLFLVPVLRVHSAERISLAHLWPGILAIVYAALLGLVFAIGQGSGSQVVAPPPGRGGAEWWLWMAGGIALVVAAYAMIFGLPRRGGAPSRLMSHLQAGAMLLIAALLLVAIFFTQSRGPWIGGAAGLFVFFTLLLIRARASEGGAPRAALWRNLLIGEVAAALVLGGFLTAFNLSNAPFFEELRKVPYIGRMGRLLEVDQGTGLVRRLIWAGDEQAGGAIALIASDPVRAIVGWGPETMFVAFNRFYPPSLANVESRGASPDRSHEAYLDELITKGVLGLVSYLFVLISFFTLAWRLTRRIGDWQAEVLLIAGIAVIAAHATEGLTGIPIVASLMLQAVTIGCVVAIGRLYGQYAASRQEAPAGQPAEAAQPAAAVAAPVPALAAVAQPAGPRAQGSSRGQGGRGGRGGRRQAVPRGSGAGQAGGRAQSRRAARGAGALAPLLYGIVVILTLLAVWSFNVDNVYADMRFQQGQTYTEDPSATLDRYIVGTSYYLDAIRMEPDQDFYYLNLGRSLMSIVDIRRQTQGVDLGQPQPGVRVEELLRQQDALAVQDFVLRQPPLALMSYAEAVLLRAHELSPLNKDHFANLARMYNFWYARLTRDPALLEKAIDWYRQGHEAAPQDVTILNEYAGAVALLGASASAQGDAAAAQAQFSLAEQLLAKSKRIDPHYADTDVRQAEVLRLQGRYAEAVDRYIPLVEKNPRALDAQISTLIDSMRDQPEQLLRLRAAYEQVLAKNPDDAQTHALVGLISARVNDLPRAAQAFSDVVRLQPQNLEARQNYTLVLSDMLRYDEAAAAAQELFTLAQQQGMSEQESNALLALVNFLQQRAAQGG